MNLTEDQLRYALQETAEEFPAARLAPLRLPAEASDNAVAGTSLRSSAATRLLATVLTPRRLAPLAAAAAVAAVIALAVGISGQTQARRTSGAPASATASPGCTRPDSQCVPRYYLERSGVIKDRVTGATVATVRLPRQYRVIEAIAGAADDRTFVLAAQAGKDFDPSHPARLFLARFNAAERRVAVSALPVPDIGPWLSGLAVSPDGSELATATLTGQGDSLLSVYSLTGRLSGRPGKVWQSPGWIGHANDDPSGISWSSTGTLAINWGHGNPANIEVRLLDTSAPSGSLLANSRSVVIDSPSLRGRASFSWDGLLTPDGTTIVAALWWEISRPSSTSKAVFQEEIEEYSAATGRLIRTMGRRTAHSVNEMLEWTNASGNVLVVAAPPGPGKKPVFGVLTGSHFRPIPGAPTPIESVVILAF
jgi:hypothetical protein